MGRSSSPRCWSSAQKLRKFERLGAGIYRCLARASIIDGGPFLVRSRPQSPATLTRPRGESPRREERMKLRCRLVYGGGA